MWHTCRSGVNGDLIAWFAASDTSAACQERIVEQTLWHTCRSGVNGDLIAWFAASDTSAACQENIAEVLQVTGAYSVSGACVTAGRKTHSHTIFGNFGPLSFGYDLTVSLNCFTPFATAHTVNDICT